MRMLRLSDSVAVAPQILPEDVPDIVDAGFRVLINNRPDGEQPGQPPSAVLQTAAEAAGLEYHYLPVTAMDFPGAGFGEMQRLMNDETRPVFAFCRSGTRCANLWVATRDENDRSAAAEYARGLGFDVSMVPL